MLLPLVPVPAHRLGRLLVLAAEGAIVCTLGDPLHVRFHVIECSHPFVIARRPPARPRRLDRLPALYLWAAWAGRAIAHAWLMSPPRAA